MSPVAVTFRRTVGRLRSQFPTALAAGLFMAAVAALFSLRLEAAEGTSASVVALWALSASALLPVVAAFLAMDVWSDERRTGRTDLLLSVAVRERDFVVGKFVGVWFALLLVVALSLASCGLALAAFAPAALAGADWSEVIAAFAALAAQGALWCAAASAVSAAFANSAASFCTSIILFAALPRGVWQALLSFSAAGRTVFGDFPFDAHVADMVSGSVTLGTAVAYVVFTVLALFVASKSVSSLRLVGRGSRMLRASTALALALAAFFAVAVTALAARLDVSFEFASGGGGDFSPRLRRTISETSGSVSATAFLSRRDPRFREVARRLRALRRAADSLGGLRLEVRYVDPRWDIGSAGRLARLGAREGSIVFEKGRRTAVLDLADGAGWNDLAPALRSLVSPPQHRDVCWAVGHGEARFDDYGSWGLSDIARDIAREGYRNVAVDLAAESPIPADCALLVVAGAKDEFSRAELGRIEAFLRDGGRLLVMLGRPGTGGVAPLLPAWGMRPVVKPLKDQKTISGTDVIVSDFADHPVSSALAGSRIVLDRPLSFELSAAAESGAGADRIEFLPLARAGGAAVVAAAERGAGAGSDLAIRPARIVAVGDAAFVSNVALAARASANRDFFLNAVAYLSGTDFTGASSADPAVLSTGLDRASRLKLTLASAALAPLLVFLVLSAVVFRRRVRR